MFNGVERHAGEGFESVVGEDVDAAVVGFEVVDLLAEEEGPEIFAEELDCGEGGGGARMRSGYSMKCMSACNCEEREERRASHGRNHRTYRSTTPNPTL